MYLLNTEGTFTHADRQTGRQTDIQAGYYDAIAHESNLVELS